MKRSKPAPKKASLRNSPKPKKVARKGRSKPTAPRTEAQYLAKPERFKDTWDRVIDAISKIRSEKLSLAQASREAGTSPRTVTKWGRSALRKRKDGKYVAKSSDKLLRILGIPTPKGMSDIAVPDFKQASLLGKYMNALHLYRDKGDASQLKTFQGQTITDADGVEFPLLTDLLTLNRMGSAGVLSFESLYARTT